MKRKTTLVALIPSIARKVRDWGNIWNRLAFWMMRGRCSVCGVAVKDWRYGDFYACEEHLEQVRERWIVAVGHAAATERVYETHD